MEIDDVLADEVVQLGITAALPVFVKRVPGAIAVVLETGDIADRRIQPDIEILAGFAGNLEAKIGGVTADVPLLQPGVDPLAQFVCYLRLQAVRGQPCFEHALELGQLEKEVDGFLVDGLGTGDRRYRVDQVCGAVGRATGLAVVAILVRGFAARAGALDKTVCKEKLFLGVKRLRDGP